MDARSAKLSSGCKDSPTNAFDEALDIYQVRPRKDKRGVDLISGKSRRTSTRAILRSGEVSPDQTYRELVYRPLQFQKRSQLFIRTHNDTLT